MQVINRALLYSYISSRVEISYSRNFNLKLNHDFWHSKLNSYQERLTLNYDIIKKNLLANWDSIWMKITL